MPISLGPNVDTRLDEFRTMLTTGTRTDFASRFVTWAVDTFKSTSNVFGTAATHTVGALTGQLPALEGTDGQPGEFNEARIPAATTTAKGAVVRATTAEHTRAATDTAKHATLAGVAAVGNDAVAQIPVQYSTFFRAFNVINRIGSYYLTPPPGTTRLVGWAVGAGPGGKLRDNNRRGTLGGVAYFEIDLRNIETDIIINVGSTPGYTSDAVARRAAGGKTRLKGGDTSILAGTTNLVTVRGGRSFQIGGTDQLRPNFANDNAWIAGAGVPASGNSVAHDFGQALAEGLTITRRYGGDGLLGYGTFQRDGVVLMWGLRGPALSPTVVQALGG